MSTVIKAANVGNMTTGLSTINLTDHVAEARRVLEEARRKATQIEQEAKVQAARSLERAKAEGHEIGFEAGKTDGVEAGRKEAFDEAMARFEADHSNAVAALAAAARGIEQLKDDLAAAAKQDLLDFAVLVARKLTFSVGKVHREAVSQNFARALRLVEGQSDVVVKVNPRDVETLETFAASFHDDCTQFRTVHVSSDETIEPGGCLVRSERTEIDVTLETQVAEMVALLTGETRS